MQATLALYAARRTSAIVVNIGFHVTSVLPSKLLDLVFLIFLSGSVRLNVFSFKAALRCLHKSVILFCRIIKDAKAMGFDVIFSISNNI